ncbi:MAG: bifunctional diaminohydroxyphosphoribosylaminopyrimidine deaminase/5-amino-6-(5-phosphoribosylamino)uracil reductase RibD [Gammaproteobacteria bacterium]|nr:bifunctional diaminohydroxyphosphoribosylaminopyrimidine deaminase/5-amino-6-(5-phosphoribosylamino)uracil reductase RibD [Gammaproteobacteria bacterium]
MARALRLADCGLYSARPNPRVGCVLVNEGRIVGEGFHARTGEAHAEINALRQAGSAAAGATAYVSLEPCCHHGRTPPCVQALIDAGIERVVAAMPDPNPCVAGQGLIALQAAGILTDCGVMASEARRLNRGFHSRMRRGRPWVRVKSAMSLDGRTAMASGESRWISGDAARRDVQYLRARSCASLSGGGTLRADNPRLNLRLGTEDFADDSTGHGCHRDPPPAPPLRVVLSSNLNIDPQARVFTLPGRCLVIGPDATLEIEDKLRAMQRNNVELITVPSNDNGLDLEAVMRELARREINEVQVEAGPTLAGALLRGNLVDELIVYMAPMLMGDAARGLAHLPDIKRMRDRLPLVINDTRIIGDDLRLTLTPAANA